MKQFSVLNIDINDCTEEICNLHGDCTDLVLDFECNCTTGWIGRTCNTGISHIYSKCYATNAVIVWNTTYVLNHK